MQRTTMLFLAGSLALGGLMAAYGDDDDDYEERHEGRERSQSSRTGDLPARTGVEKQSNARRMPTAHNATWQQECSACHTLYVPSLLPARSWQKMMGGLTDHFGEDASLDATATSEIAGFLSTYAADAGWGGRGERVARSISPADTPLRITGTRWFQGNHHELSPAVFKRAAIKGAYNCTACHGAAAEQGVFDEERVRIPK